MDSFRSQRRLHSEDMSFVCYECPDCEKSFTQSTDLWMHMKKHYGEKLCKDDDDDSDGCLVTQNVEDTVEQGVSNFSNVDTGFIVESIVDTEVDDITGEGITETNVSLQPDGVGEELNQTVSITKSKDDVHDASQIWSVCTNKFTTKGEKPGVWSICTKGFSIKGESSLVCRICRKYFMCESDLKFHMVVHSQEKTYMCGKPYPEKRSINVRKVSESDHKPYSCTASDKGFPDISTLGIHAKTPPATVKPHKCNLCLKKFPKKGTLKRHMRVHSGEKSFVCTSCGIGFKLKEHLTRHEKSHSTHVCKLCHLVFKNGSKLRKHMVFHTSERLYVCRVCGQDFSDGTVHKKHMASQSCEKSSLAECNKGSELSGLRAVNDACNQVEEENAMKEKSIETRKISLVKDGFVKTEHLITKAWEKKPIVTESFNRFVVQVTKDVKEEPDVVIDDYPMIEDYSLFVKEEIPGNSSAYIDSLESRIQMCNTDESDSNTIINEQQIQNSDEHSSVCVLEDAIGQISSDEGNGSNEAALKCHVCFKEYMSETNLEKHMKQHTEEKPLGCNVCDRQFSQKVHLMKHMDVHKTFSCKLCGKVYSNCENKIVMEHMTEHLQLLKEHLHVSKV